MSTCHRSRRISRQHTSQQTAQKVTKIDYSMRRKFERDLPSDLAPPAPFKLRADGIQVINFPPYGNKCRGYAGGESGWL
jgi:hypothetical protein